MKYEYDSNRADSGERLINFYRGSCLNGDGDDDSIVSDILSDLRHLCAREGVDFDAAVLVSEINFEQEK